MASTAVRLEARALWRLAWPILVGQLATVGLSVADLVMAGHVSAQDLAGVSLGVSIWSIFIVTLMGTLMAVNPIVAQQFGAGEWTRVPGVVRQALWTALGVGVLAALAAHAAALVFARLDVEPAVQALASGFMRVIGFSLPAFCCFRVLYGYSASVNQTTPMMVIALAALALKLVLGWALVFGHFGIEAMGGIGCAWSTLLCIWFNLGAMTWWICRDQAYRSTQPFARFDWPRWPEMQTLLRIGLPIGVTFFAESSAFSLIALLVAGFGTTQVAAHQIALNFASLAFMLPMSLGVALLTRVGQAIGAGDPTAARFRAGVGVGMALLVAGASGSLIALLNRHIASAYTSDAGVCALASTLLLFAALFQLSDAAQVAASCAIRAYKVTRAPMLIHLGAFWGLSLPLGCVLGLAPAWLPWRPAQPMAAQGFWIALSVGLAVAALALTWLLNRLSAQRQAPLSA